MSGESFDPSPADVIDMETSCSASPYHSTSSNSTPRDSIWDKPDYSSDELGYDTPLSDDIFGAFSNPGDEGQSLQTIPLKATNVAEPWSFDEAAYGSFSPENERTLPGCETPLPCAPNDPMELIDPRLRDAPSLSVFDLPLIAGSPNNGHRLEPQPAAINAKERIWEAEALLAKLKEYNTNWYLVKWKGFAHEDNTWQKRNDISLDLIKSFEATFKGNHYGIQLLKKRKRQGRVEYFVNWKGRPERENSWH
ncbi:hypothetical protein VE02_01552 [Pseudogymnoascus sp. 03VT05]|nr:hypothetical protein VE02_01552 [Pseudogymnoascus sp. 03VT05]